MDGPVTAEGTARQVTALTLAEREALLVALRAAVSQPGPHRLFRAGKWPGLFGQRTGPAAAAAQWAIREGLLEVTHREVRGKLVTEWVAATPQAVRFVHEQDSPQAALRELQAALELGRAGIPRWLEEAREQLQRLGEELSTRAAAVQQRLEQLAAWAAAAVRRAELQVSLAGEPLLQRVPWAAAALAYLDQRQQAGAATPCPLAELFRAVREEHAELTIPAFHAGLVQIADARLVELVPGPVGASQPAAASPSVSPAAAPTAMADAPEFAMIYAGQVCHAVRR